jgi:hypothetical protein
MGSGRMKSSPPASREVVNDGRLSVLLAECLYCERRTMQKRQFPRLALTCPEVMPR